MVPLPFYLALTVTGNSVNPREFRQSGRMTSQAQSDFLYKVQSSYKTIDSWFIKYLLRIEVKHHTQ